MTVKIYDNPVFNSLIFEIITDILGAFLLILLFIFCLFKIGIDKLIGILSKDKHEEKA